MHILDIEGARIGCLGDPHLGRRFLHDVPLHRRGEREAQVRAGFRAHMLATVGLDVHVCMGDLFDRPVVSPETLLFAVDTYLEAVARSRTTDFIVLAGNHDLSRDTEVVTSFDLFSRMVSPHGVRVLRDEAMVQDDVLFAPWSAQRTAAEMVEDWADQPLRAAFGHWDLVNPSSSANMVPRLRTRLYVTGHDHKAREETRHGARTLCTGSMQAYAHGEGEPYCTVTLTELETISKDELRQLCVRVRLGQGEELPDGIDALQVSAVREKGEDAPDVGVQFESFDMASVFRGTLAEYGVGHALADVLFERYRSRA